MAAYRDEEAFGAEFALRTQINYLELKIRYLNDIIAGLSHEIELLETQGDEYRTGGDSIREFEVKGMKCKLLR